MTDSRAISELAKTQGYLGFQGSPRVFGGTELKEDDVKFVAGEVAHDDRVKTLLVRNMNISNKSIQFLADIIALTPSVSNLLLYQNQVSSQGVKILSEALAQNRTITKLNIGQNFFPFGLLCEGMAMCPTLTELDFSYLEMGEGTALDDFIKAFANNTTVSKMTLFSNRFTERHGRQIGKLINTLRGLRKIDLSVNELGDEGMDDVCKALSKNSHLKAISVGANGLTCSCCDSIAQLLLENTCLTSLNLINNRIGVEGVAKLAESLKKNTSLQHLNLNKNCLGNEGVRALAAGITQNDGVRSLSLYHNRIGHQVEAGRALFDLVSCNTTLTSLNIGINPLGEEIICSVCNGVSFNKTLRSLCLQRVRFGTEKANEALCNMLEDNKSLTCLSLSHCRFSDTIWPNFFKCLSKNTTLMNLSLVCVLNTPDRIALLRDYLILNPPLQSINIGDNNIRPEECQFLAQALRANTCLTCMGLDSNCVEFEGGKAIIDALEENRSIVELFKQKSYIGEALFSRMEELIARNRKCVIQPAVETFLFGVDHANKESPISLLRDFPSLSQHISQLALPEWHSHNIIDQLYSE